MRLIRLKKIMIVKYLIIRRKGAKQRKALLRHRKRSRGGDRETLCI